MRYDEQLEARARELGVKILEHQDKRYSGYEMDPNERLRGADFRATIRIFDIRSAAQGGRDSSHEVLLFRAERIYVCDCEAQEWGRACKHVGMALEQMDLEARLAAEEEERMAPGWDCCVCHAPVAWRPIGEQGDRVCGICGCVFCPTHLSDHGCESDEPGFYSSENGYQVYVGAPDDGESGEELSSCEHCGDVTPDRALRQVSDDEGLSISVCPKCWARGTEPEWTGPCDEDLESAGFNRGSYERMAREVAQTLGAPEPVLYRSPAPFSIWKSEL